ncbi:MAG: UxaA family hydrolase [Anaerolineae bacterium]
MSFDLQTVSRRAAPADNVVIATRKLPAGTVLHTNSQEMTLRHTVLEGHRFAIKPLQPGDILTSWGQPFGKVIHPMHPGDVLCNEAVLRELGRRSLDFALPEQPNFSDYIPPFAFDESGFRPAAPPLPAEVCGVFQGYRRTGGRGVGTRNMIVLLGTSALTGGFVRVLESRLKSAAAQVPQFDGIVAVAHTEGGTDQPNNRDLLLRTLAGVIVHPNVGAILIVDRGTEVVNNTALRNYMEAHDYPFADVLHHFMTLSPSFEDDLQTATTLVRGWIDPVSQMPRTEAPASELRIGLQCGGSDAFSGISGNPLIAWVTKELIRCGASANLAETDELIGAEVYVVSRMRDLATARKFLQVVERFKTLAAWHGQSAHGNPSGGNLYRGLYNVYLKSLGAATKLHPELRVDAVIDYGERMAEPGFYFMDSPGNDLESIAGQVAAGCNLIFFVTGNGSITNFPFVPTIKVVTTSERYRLLAAEMDVNAGAYLEGTPMADIGASALALTLEIASGRFSAGEQAGHAQVQIWRDWRQTGGIQPVVRAEYSGQPLNLRTEPEAMPALQLNEPQSPEQVGLIMPTSLCSGQIGRMCADWLNQQGMAEEIGVSRFVALAHTEGCGASIGYELPNTLLGYLSHPMVKHALLLEHGCERTHNAFFRQQMVQRGLDPARYGWASIQLDGGIQQVMHKIIDWFRGQPPHVDQPGVMGRAALQIAWISQGDVSEIVARSMARLTKTIAAAGGSMVLPENDALLAHPVFQHDLAIQPQITLSYAQVPQTPGLHVMDMPTRQWGEMITGLGAAGVSLIVGHITQQPMFGHPLIPVLQVTTDPGIGAQYAADLDRFLAADESLTDQLRSLMTITWGGGYIPRVRVTGNMDFQITRGLLGVSL